MAAKPLVIGEYEALVADMPSAKRLSAYASAWCDLRAVMQMCYDREQLPNDSGHLYTRRALWDAAVVAYGRCFNTGRRSAANLRPLLTKLDAEERASHDAALAWRNRHAAHRVDEDLETAETFLVWPNFGKGHPFARVRVHTRITPEPPGAADLLQSVAKTLADAVWHDFLWPLQDELLKEDAATLSRRGKAAIYHKPRQLDGIVSVELNIGEKPLPSRRPRTQKATPGGRRKDVPSAP